MVDHANRRDIEQEMFAAIRANLPDIDHVELLRCGDRWFMALMHGDEFVMPAFQAAVDAGPERLLDLAAKLIDKQFRGKS